MGANDTLEQLRAAQAYAVELEAENATLKASLADAERTLVELKPAEVLVEGSYFAVDDLPTILGNFMRASADYARDAKAAYIRTLELAAVIEQALGRSNFMDDTTASTWAGMVSEMRGILASADTDAALREVRAKALDDARVRPEFTEYLPNDGEYEYTSASDCDGSNVRYWRRRPKYVGDFHPWEAATKEAHDAAAIREGRA